MIGVHPIFDADLPAAARFMHEQINKDLPLDVWISAFSHPWSERKPNNGFLIRDGAEIVGVLGAIYSTQAIGGVRTEFCNLTSLSVMPRYRARTMDLFARCMGQGDYQLTNFTPNQAVERICSLLRFRPIDTRQYLIPHQPVAAGLARVRALGGDEAEAALSGEQLKVYQDHKAIPWIRRVVFAAAGRACLLVFKTRTVTRLKLTAAHVLYIGDREVYMTHLPAIGAHLAWRHGILASFADQRLLPGRPRFALDRADPQTRLFKGHLQDPEIPMLYSELVALPL